MRLLSLLRSLPVLAAPPPRLRTRNQRLAAIPNHGAPLERELRIYWDKHQIPCISADTDADAAFALGVVHAHLRLGQIELLRMAARGRLSQLLGPRLIKVDHSLRLLDFGRRAADIRRSMQPETLLWLERFVAGLNFCLRSGAAAPHEFTVLQHTPEPYTPEDLITMARLVSADVNWLVWFRLLPLAREPHFPELWQRILQSSSRSMPSFEVDDTVLSILSEQTRSGSNAFAVSGLRTTSKAALLAGDPHLGFQLPNVWLLAGVQSPSYHTTGLMIPGLPFVAVGRNKNIAWGGTNMWAIASSLYDLSGVPLSAITVRRERIAVRWSGEVEIELRESPYGPVITDAPLLSGYRGPPLALRWLGHDVSDEIGAFLKVNRARSWQEFRAAFSDYAISGQNMVYADRDGHIGQLLAARFSPPASTIDKTFVFDPLDPEHQWRGLFKSTDLPSVLDPPQGFLASTNNVPAVFRPAVGRFHPSNDRQTRICRRLHQAEEPIAARDLHRLQQDVQVPTAQELKSALTGWLRELGLNGKPQRLAKVLEDWEGSFIPTARGPTIYCLLVYEIAAKLYRRTLGTELGSYILSSSYLPEFLLEDLTALSAAERSPLLKGAITAAARRRESKLPWGGLHRIKLQHPFGSAPLIGHFYRWGSLPAPGTQTSVLKTAHPFVPHRHYSRYGAVARFCTDLASPDENYAVLLGGQDGYLGSENFLDQVPLWQRGEYIQLPMSLELVKQAAVALTVMTAGGG